MASLLLNNTAKAILLALLGTGLLSACGGGGGGGTVRNPDNGNGETPTPETTYKLSISSPVTLQNVNVKVITLTNKEIGQGSISKGSTLTLDIKASDVNQILIAEISPKNNSSMYYDPALNATAAFDTKLHRVFIMTAGAKTVSVDPFSEIAYQRMLVRSGQLDKTNPEIRNILSADIDSSRNEVLTTFRVDIPGESTPISKRSDYERLDFTIKPDSPNTQLQYANAFFSLGHYLIQKNQNPADKTPYLTFAKRAAEDMRDGSLDGRTLIGDGTDGKINSDILKNPIISTAPLNTNPAFNVIRPYNAAEPEKDESNKDDTIKGIQKASREAYAALWKANIDAFLNLLPIIIDGEGKESLLTFNYAEGLGGRNGNFTQASFGLHSFGAGNYKRAFGIETVVIPKGTEQHLLDKDCRASYISAPANKDKRYTPGCAIGINVSGDDVSAPYNTIQALVGQYTSVESCKLSIDYKGNVKLSKGDQVFTPPTLSPSEFHSIIHVGANDADQSYVLNVADGSDSSGTYVQLKVVNQKIVSATVGVSADANNKFPKQLINQKLNCTFQYS